MKISGVRKLLANFVRDLKEFSLSVAVGRLSRDLPIGKWENRRKRYEKTILGYLKKHYPPSLFGNYEIREYEKPDYKNTLWVMWLQGEKNMPPVVESCWKQMQRVFKNERLVLLTEKNLADYINIPFHITDKYKKGLITATHFSDIVRVMLLNKYGGCWLDATLWFNSYPCELMNREFYTLHAPGMFNEFISRGNWSSFLMASRSAKSRKLYCYLERAFFEYWRRHDAMIDYLWIDYFILIMLEKDLELKHDLDELPCNRDYYMLNLRMNEPWSHNVFTEMMHKSEVQKLTYKGKLIERNADGQLTNYGYILSTRTLNV